MRKVESKEVKKLTQGHIVSYWHSWEFDSGLRSAQLSICSTSNTYNPSKKAVVWHDV